MKSSLIVLMFFTLSAFGKPCGLEGNIEARIKDCNVSKNTFVLVARNDKGFEIYKDTKSNLIWSDRHRSDYNHYGSQKACAGDTAEGQLIKDLKWRLPSIREFEDAGTRGMKTAVTNMNYWFWTSSPVVIRKTKKGRRRRIKTSQVYLWDGTEQVSDVGELKDAASVRCVTKD